MVTLPISAKITALIAGCLLTAAPLFATPADPAKPTPFNTSIYIAKDNRIRLAIEKTAADPVIISLRPLEAGQPCVYSRIMGKKQPKLALKLDVSELADGVYELAIKSSTGQLIKQITLATPAKQAVTIRSIALLPLPATDAMFSVK